MDESVIAPSPVVTEAPVENKLPWETPAVTEFNVADVTLAGGALPNAGDGVTYS